MVDMAPGVGKISPEFHSYINAMKEIEKAAVHSRKEADEILAEYEPVRPLYLPSPVPESVSQLRKRRKKLISLGIAGSWDPPVPTHEPRSVGPCRTVRVPPTAGDPFERAGGDWRVPVRAGREGVDEAGALPKRCVRLLRSLWPLLGPCAFADLLNGTQVPGPSTSTEGTSL